MRFPIDRSDSRLTAASENTRFSDFLGDLFYPRQDETGKAGRAIRKNYRTRGFHDWLRLGLDHRMGAFAFP